jgi:hypothetical protein
MHKLDAGPDFRKRPGTHSFLRRKAYSAVTATFTWLRLYPTKDQAGQARYAGKLPLNLHPHGQAEGSLAVPSSVWVMRGKIVENLLDFLA